MAKPSSNQSSGWTNTQVYTAIVVVLILGALGGYLAHNSGSTPAASTTSAPASGLPASSGDLQAQALNAQVSSMEAKLQANPRDVSLLTALGNAYFDAGQWSNAINYYTRSLNEAPKNADVRTDLGISYFYSGDADRALREFDQALKDDPVHVQTLFNEGIVKLQGKHDAKGALAAWEQLLKIEPQYRDRAKVEQLMAEAKAQIK